MCTPDNPSKLPVVKTFLTKNVSLIQTAELELLTVEKRRLEYAIQATEGPLHIARDCLGNRQRRIDYDLVQDAAEKELLKEIELISQVQSTLSKTLQQTRDQMEACKEAKHRLEMDWSDKYTAQGLGQFIELVLTQLFCESWLKWHQLMASWKRQICMEL